MKERRLKIVSDGTMKHTSVVDAETGERIANVSKIEIEMDWNQMFSTARITIILPEFDIEAIGQLRVE